MSIGVGDIFSGLNSAVNLGANVASLFGGGKGQSKMGPGFKGNIVTPSYTFGGGKVIARDPYIQNNRAALYGQLGQLGGEVRPGYGRLTSSGVEAIRAAAGRQVGNLRAQQAKRGLEGASFAQNDLNNLQLSYQKAEDDFRAQAWERELAASQSLIAQQSDLLAQQATQQLSELGIATNFLASVNQGIQSKATIKTALKQYELEQKLNAGVNDIGHAAMGGPIEAGRPYMVGERGPELVVPRQNATVIPNHMLGGMENPVSRVLQGGLAMLSQPNVLPQMDPQQRALGGLAMKSRNQPERGRSEAAGRNI